MADSTVLTNPCDDQFANVKLLVVFDGTDGSRNIKDDSPTNKLPQLVQNVAVTTENKVFRTGSGTYNLDLENYSNQYNQAHLTFGPSSDLSLAGNWTLDFYLKIKSGRPVSSGSDDEYFMSPSFQQYFRIDTQSPPRLHCTWFSGMEDVNNGLATIYPETWYHIALVHKENNEWYFYVNGNLVKAGVNSGTPPDYSGG